MFINKFTKAIIYSILICILIIPNLSFADDSLGEMKDKIEDQNKYMLDEILKHKKDGENPLDSIMDDVRKRDQEIGRTIDLGKISDSLHVNSIALALFARKYIVPITILMLLVNVFMLSTMGAKNYQKRKKYILGSVFIFILFLVVLNFPIYLLWRYSTGVEGFLSFEGFYRFVEGAAFFLKRNSFVFFIIIFTFGVINVISSEYNYPRLMASKYLIKMSFILLVLFNILPFILKMAV